MKRLSKGITLLLFAAGFLGCAGLRGGARNSLCIFVEQAGAAGPDLPKSLPRYNRAVKGICRSIEDKPLAESAKALRACGVTLELPPVALPLRRLHVAAPGGVASGVAGTPVILEYETRHAPLHPPEGLFVDGCAVFVRETQGARLAISIEPGTLPGTGLPLARNPSAAGDSLRKHAGRLARSGFVSMIRPASMQRKSRIYLLDPYDPAKIPVLMVHGLQSTPVAFAKLVNALRGDPEVRCKYQIWQFYYASGTPVLANAAALRDALERTLRILDPQGRAPASRSIVVIGHSMGGVISHTLVSSSGESVWGSVFRVPPERLKGDPEAIRTLRHILDFRRDPRVSRVIFLAAPHRGSPMAESFLGGLGHALSRLPAMEEHGFSSVAAANPGEMMPEAAAFYAAGRFSAVRTLSPKSTALIAVSKLPIEVPFHSVIGQQYPGPKERGSDGVVPYASSHLAGAESEKIIRSGHNLISHPAAIAQILRILRRNARSARER